MRHVARTTGHNEDRTAGIAAATLRREASRSPAGSDVAPVPLQNDSLPQGLAVCEAPTRCRALAALLAAPESRRAIGSAWPLYLMLALQWGGTATGNRDEIGEKMGEDGRNVGNWISALEQAGIMTVVRAGRRMKIVLTGAHMNAARMPEAVTVAEGAGAPEPALDERQREMLDLMAKARSMGGEAEVRIVVKAK